MHETGHSTGEVSLRGLVDGVKFRVSGGEAKLPDVVERLIGGGWPVSQGLPLRDATRYARAYLDQTAKVDVVAADGNRHDPVKVAALLRSLARTVASESTIRTLAADAGGSAGPLHPDTVSRYLTALQRIYVLELQEAWGPRLRTRTPLRDAPKRHLVDTSLVCAALRIGAVEQLLQDPETLGCAFESLVVQQLRAWSSLCDAEVKHFRDKTGLEVDAIVQRDDGAWAAFEIKLGPGRIEEGVAVLKKLASVVDQEASGRCGALVVVVPTGPSYVRDDGVAVVSLTTLGP
jgi:predicted AAA+ superfamily ATPase